MPVLYLTVFIDLVGFGMIFPVLPFIALEFGASAQAVTLLIATYSATQMISAPIWGRLSDRYGRKSILVLTLAGGAASYVWFGLAESLAGLFAARALAGVMAGHFAVANAYVADLTTPQNRAAGMGRLGAAVGLGFVGGPALGGLLAGQGYQLPCFVGAAISALSALLGLVLLREPDRRGVRSHTGIAEAFAALGHREFALRCAAIMAITFAFSQAIALYPLWAAERFQWGAEEAGIVFAAVGLVIALVQGAVVPPLSRRVGEWRLLAAGAALLGVALAASGAIGEPWLVATQIVLVGLGMSLASPSAAALASRAAPADHQGSAMGAASAAGSLARIVGPPIAGFLFTQAGPDWPFALAGLSLLPLAALAAARARRRAASLPA